MKLNKKFTNLKPKPGEFIPPAKKPVGRRTYMIDGEPFVLLSKAELMKEISASNYEGAKNRKEIIMKDVNEQARKKNQVLREKANLIREKVTEKVAGEILILALQYTLCCSTRVLIEQFHWKPIPTEEEYDLRNKTYKYAMLLSKEIFEHLAVYEDGSSELDELIRYCNETYQKYGVRYTCDEDGEDDLDI